MTTSATDYSALSLPAHVLVNLQPLGYWQMTPSHSASLPVALLGKDLIAQAKTGNGKPRRLPWHCWPISMRGALRCRL